MSNYNIAILTSIRIRVIACIQQTINRPPTLKTILRVYLRFTIHLDLVSCRAAPVCYGLAAAFNKGW
jgi:hypothetical protein